VLAATLLAAVEVVLIIQTIQDLELVVQVVVVMAHQTTQQELLQRLTQVAVVVVQDN
jgi:hypothetical protein